MSATLLVTDLMRKTLPEKKYVKWVKEFCPDLFIKENVKKALIIKRSAKHDGYESHWDGYHLNRIWCLNGMLKTLPPEMLNDGIKDEWVKSMNEMWDYAHSHNLDFFEGNIVKYVTRWKQKNGIEDLKKAKQYLDKLIVLNESNNCR
jgi:hypothetical protein